MSFFPSRTIGAAALAFVALNCGGGGGGNGTVDPGPRADFSGIWVASESRDDTACGGGVSARPNYEMTIGQTGATLTISSSYGVLSAQVTGTHATVTGTLRDGADYIVFPPFDLVMAGGSITGTAPWTSSPSPTGSPATCSGSSTFLLRRRFELRQFVEDGSDRVALNHPLVFEFSRPVDPDSVDPASIQIRRGAVFGNSIAGEFVVSGSTVTFFPMIPGRCDLSDGGLAPNLSCRVTVVGSPEEFAVRSMDGVSLDATSQFSFMTAVQDDPHLFEDPTPGVAPTVLSTTPIDGAFPEHANASIAQSVLIGPTNHVVIHFSKNLSPCSVSTGSILFFQYATGAAGTTPTGFSPKSDQTPGDPFTWGSGTPSIPPVRVDATCVLTQSAESTTVELVPVAGQFPMNALLVVQVTSGVTGFDGTAAVPMAFAFVTESRP